MHRLFVTTCLLAAAGSWAITRGASVEFEMMTWPELKEAIAKGKTTRAEVTQLVGKPGGSHIYPLINSTTGDAAVYIYAETTSEAPFSVKQFRKVLIVSFDASGFVSDVESISSGTR